MSEPELKPCPFCGRGQIRTDCAPGSRWSEDSVPWMRFWAYCLGCGARGPETETRQDVIDREPEHSPRQAMQLWNTRTPEPDRP